MRKIVAIASLVLMLAGCTAASPSPGLTSSSPTSPSPTVPPIQIPAGACLQPSDAAIQWVRNYLNDPGYATSNISVVEAGEGNFASETWDVVAIRSVQSTEGDRIYQSFLTNANSAEQPSGEQWIDIGTSAAPVWGSVTWTGTRLVNGQQAQKIAFACLGWQP